MKTKCVKWMNVLLFAVAMLLLPSCDNEPMGSGDVEFEITDAPSDDTSVDAVMVTVADVLIDGKSVSGFSKQTINLKAYQEGDTKLLAKAMQVNARTYQSITLVLDLNEDVGGNAPGCYVRTIGGAKYKLKSTASGKMNVVLAKSWSVRNNATTKIVMDFDLRKAIAYSDDAEIRYQFVSDAHLEDAVRVMVKDRTGSIEGTCELDESVSADKIIVYAYKKGTFNASVETQAQGEEGRLFAKAVTSAEVKQGLGGKTFTLAFLEEGEYELHFAAHEYNTETARMNFSTMLQSELSVNGSVANIVKINSGASVVLSSQISVEL
jgi:hypothetical protein